MNTFKRSAAILLALVLILTSTIAGLVLPAAAEGDTFKLAKDELYLTPTDAGGYVVYASVNALTLDGKAYTESLTWSSSNTSLVTVNADTGRIQTVSTNKNGTGSAVITAKNAAGESHSCTVYVVFDGECISGGDFESADATGMYSLNRWTPIIKSGKAELVTEADGNHCLKIPAGLKDLYYGSLTSLPSTTYMISFDIKGDTGEIMPLFISNSTANGWKYATPNADSWKHYSWTYTVKSSVSRSYQIALGNQNITNGTNTNPIYIDNLSVVALGTAESIALSNSELNMQIGNEATLSVTASPEGATFNRVQWSSDNEAVAKVDKDGKVTGVSAGTATITATSGKLTATCEVTVTKVSATGIKLNKTNLELAVDESETLEVTVIPDGVELEDDIVWETTNPTIATVDNNGKVTAVSAGKVVVTATAGTLTAKCTVTVSNTAEDYTFKLAKDELYLAPAISNNSNTAVSASVPVLKPDGTAYTGKLTWTSNNKELVTVDPSTGLIKTTAKTGTAVITAADELGEQHSCTVYVTFDGECVSGGDLESSDATEMYDTTSTASHWYELGQYRTSDEDGNHVLKIPASTTSAKYYRSLPVEPGKKYVLSFDIKGNTGSTKALYTSSTYTTVVGSSKTSYSASGWQSITPKADTWTHYEFYIQTKDAVSSNRSYVFSFGNSSTTEPVYFDNVSFYELGTAESISLSDTTLPMEIGDTTTLSVTAAPENATMNRVQWSSSNETVVTVDKDGKVTAMSTGTATITATSGLLSATCEVTVSKGTVISIALDKTALELLIDESEKLTASVLPEDAEIPDGIIWKSSDDAIATVNNGTVTAVSAGTVIVTATAGKRTAMCTVTVLNASKNDTFRLAKDELYLAPADSKGNAVYAVIPALTLKGDAYTGRLTWTTDNSDVVAISDGTTGLLKTVKDSLGTVTVTATNDAGESHSCKITVAFDGERISGGDFENDATSNTTCWTTNITKSNKAEIITEANGNNCLKIEAINDDYGALFYENLPAEPNHTYKISLDIKGPTPEIKPLYIGAAEGKGNGWKYATPTADWKHYSWIFTTKDTIDSNGILGFGNNNILNGENNAPIYIDNVSLYEVGTAESISLSPAEVPMEIGDTVNLSVIASPEGTSFTRPIWSSTNPAIAAVNQDGKVTAMSAGTATITATSTSLAGALTASCTVTVYKELLAVIPDANMKNGTVSSDAVIGVLQPGDIVTITVTPDDGYLLVPGSLKYVTKHSHKTGSILNKELPVNIDHFGSTAFPGNTFQFVMPDESVTIYATFASTEHQNFQMQTVGTSVHQKGVDANGEPFYDGVRFLTRLNIESNLADGEDPKFNVKADYLWVRYKDEVYEVIELGSLLKHSENETELTYENALAYEAAVAAGQPEDPTAKIWISPAYTKNSKLFRLVDFTVSYLDFVSVMQTTDLTQSYTATGYMRLQKGNEVITVPCAELENSIHTALSALPPVETIEGVTGVKQSSYAESHTVAPGEELTYTIKVNNPSGQAGTVTVFDPIPENTTYVTGADELIRDTAVWTLTFNANETEKVLTYTVKINNDMELCNGGSVVATTAQVGDLEVACDSTLYIERTVNSADAKYVNTAIEALADSSYSDMKFVYWVYYLAYSSSISNYSSNTGTTILNAILNGSSDYIDTVAPTLYGGTQVTGQIAGAKGEPAASVAESDLMIGDVLLVKNGTSTSVYVYCDNGLMKVKTTGGAEKADIALLDTLTTSQAYAVIRPRIALTNTTSVDPEATPVELNEKQNAVIKTAEAFLMRGEKTQYEDTDFGNPTASEYRWRLKEDAPEDATDKYIKYTNCAAFCYDSYYFGLGYALPDNMYTTFNMVRASATNGSQKYLFTRRVTDTHTAEEMQEVHDTFMNLLQPGDLMIVLRDTNNDGNANDSGHVMMYIGNGKMIHATGNSYNNNTGTETIEPAVRYGQVEDYFFNPASTNGYVFGTTVAQFCLVRPFDLSGAKKITEVPENTTNRINNLTGIVAQKYASCRPGKTLNNGETITYTFDLRNTTDSAKTLTITDIVPEGTTYVSSTGDAGVEGSALTWSVTVAANAQTTVSYTVKINNDVVAGTKITANDATVGGVKLDCPAITVDKTLTETEQQAIVDAYNDLVTGSTTLRGIELVNEIYKRAGLLDVAFADTDVATITTGEQGIFTATGTSSGYQRHQLSAAGNTYRDMVAPTLYGGMYLDSPLWQYDRTRLAYQDDLVVGDILIGRVTSGYGTYLYIGGDKFINLSTLNEDTMTVGKRLEYVPSWRYFYAVLRPSLTMAAE